MRGENLDFAAPMAWNQFNPFSWMPIASASKWQQEEPSPFCRRGAFRFPWTCRADRRGGGHSNPWFFGPRDPVYVDRDFNNGDAIAFLLARNGAAGDLRPIRSQEHPTRFADLSANPVPYELLVDGVLTPGVGLEIVCMWTSSIGTSEVWYRFLNIGRAMPATSGTDMMANFYRTPAIGTARAYLPAPSADTGFALAVDQVRQGTGFVTTGPALLFSVGGSRPGGTVDAGSQAWTVDLASVTAVEKVEILVNGQVVETLDGFGGKRSKRYCGIRLSCPKGG